MSTLTGTTWPPGPPPEPLARITVEQYHAMIDAGILTEDAAVELLEGYLVEKMPKKPRHSQSTRKTRKALEKIAPPGWIVDTQEPVTTSDSEPEPDIAVLRGDEGSYGDRHPGPGDVGLVVEVSETTLVRDRGIKKRIYARAAVPVYWIVNLVDNQVEVYRDPTGPAETPTYQHDQVYKSGDAIPIVLDGIEIGKIEVTGILP